jgi:4-amino-4-deoxy-L-arabinose transferase-like glycosyltransferase
MFLPKLSRLEIIALVIIFLLYFILRLPSLTLQPVFIDEAVYIHWAQTIISHPQKFLLPLADGKTPLFMWITIPFLKIFPNPLFAARLLSVFSGFLTLLGVLVLGWKFFNRRVGIFVTFLVAVVPYSVFFDRMALVDSMLSAFLIWVLIIGFYFVKKPRFWAGLILGGILAGAILVKTPAVLAFLALPVLLLTLNFADKKERKKAIILAGVWVAVLFCALAFYSIARMNNKAGAILARNSDYYFPLSRLYEKPFDPFVIHLKQFLSWLPAMLTWPVLVIFAMALLLALTKKEKNALVILLWVIVPNIIFISLVKSFTTRYILFTIPPILVLTAWGVDVFINQIKVFKTFVLAVFLLTIASFALSFDFFLLTNPEKAPLPRESRRGYFEDWTAGYGLKETAALIESQSKISKVTVATNGIFGVCPEGLEIYFENNPNVSFVTDFKVPSLDLLPYSKNNRTYFVSNLWSFANGSNLKLVEKYPKAKGLDVVGDALMVFEVKEEN